MSVEKECIKIDIISALPQLASKNRSKLIHEVWKFAIEDSNRVKFAFKVGLAVFLASLLVLIREPYELFGATNIIWAILTVAIMFEYSVGTTFNKGFNRAIGTLSAGVLGMVMIQVAMNCGHVAEPYIIGFSIFIVALATSFMRLWPSLTQYEYGFRVILFSYCMIIMSSYRMGNPVRIVVDRLYSIAIGGMIAVLVNVLVFPVWAGEQLHKELAGSFTSMANALQECADNYLRNDDVLDQLESSKTIVDEKLMEDPAFQKCRATMNSSAKLDLMVSSAKWEPPHGKFRQIFYPWPQYLQVGAVLRYCGFEVMALGDCLQSEIQAPYNLRVAFRSEIHDVVTQAVKLLCCLGEDINEMKCSTSIQTSLLKQVHSSTDQLQRSIELHSYLLIFADELNGGMKRQHRRLYSWPSRKVDEGDGDDDNRIPEMQTLESVAAALSLATFTSLLIEFVARMDHLVDAADELSKMANFRQEGKS